MTGSPDHRNEEEAAMDEKSPEAASPKVTIRNVTRSSLSFQVPGESIRLMPGQSVEVHRVYLETAELKTLCDQGAVTEIEPRAATSAAPTEGDAEAASDPARRAGPRKR
jgi:hypothetical protein